MTIRQRLALCVLLLIFGTAALLLSGCTTTRYSTAYCLTQTQLDEMKRSQPPKVKNQLTGQADQDLKIVAGSAIRLRAHDDGLLGVLGGCVEPGK